MRSAPATATVSRRGPTRTSSPAGRSIACPPARWTWSRPRGRAAPARSSRVRAVRSSAPTRASPCSTESATDLPRLDHALSSQPSAILTRLSGLLQPRFEKLDVLRVGGQGSIGSGDLLETQQILFGRHTQNLRPDLHRRCGYRELGCGYREVEQQIDPKPRSGVEEIRTRRCIGA